MWDEPGKLNVTKRLKNTFIFVPDSSGCCPTSNGMAEKIPVEPDQGNACAGKVTTRIRFSPPRIPPFFDLLSIDYT
jgi:hypothetical protein